MSRDGCASPPSLPSSEEVCSTSSELTELSTKTLSAHDLLSLFLDLRQMNPNLKEWSEEQFADNPPRLIRLKMLKALFRAYAIPWEPFLFSIGAFISPGNPLYVPLLEKARRAKGLPPASGLPKFFETLLDYRRLVESMRCFSDGILGASDLWAYAHNVAWGVTEKTLENVRGIDEDLAFIVDPEGKTFTVEELISTYGYINADLSEIDWEWV